MASFKCTECRLNSVCLFASKVFSKTDKILHRGETISVSSVSGLAIVRTGMLIAADHNDSSTNQVYELFFPSDLISLKGNQHSLPIYHFVAIETSSVCIIPFSGLYTACLSDKALLLEIISYFATRKLLSQSHLLHIKPTKRVAKLLSDIYWAKNQYGMQCSFFLVNLTQRQMGSYLGLSEESICRELRYLKDSKLINKNKKQFEIQDISALDEYIGH